MTTLKSTFRQGQDTFLGAQPSMWFGDTAPDGDAHPWKDAAVGSMYVYRATGITVCYTKVSDSDDDADWMGEGVVYDTDVVLADFTDGGGAAGTFTMTADIPVGAYDPICVVRNVTGFAGDTSAVITVGDGSDPDRYNTGTPSVFATAAVIVMGVPSGVREHAAAISPVVTVTSAADFGAVSAGGLDIFIRFKVQG